MNKKFWIVILILVVAAGGFVIYKNNKKSYGEAIKIGTIFALSGDAASWGEDELNAVRLAIDEANAQGGINGKKIELISEDAPGTAQYDKAIAAYRKLAEVDKVNVVIGPTWDQAAQTIAPLTDQEKVVAIAPDVTQSVEADKDYPYLFTAWTPLSPEMARLSRFAQDHGFKKIAVVHNTDGFSSTIAKSFISEANKLGLDISETAIVDTGSKDFRTYITKLKNQNFDALYIEFADAAYKCPFLKQAKDLGLNKPILSTSSTNAKDILNSCAGLLIGVDYTYQKQGDKYDSLLSKYKEKYGTDPITPAVANAYDVTNMVIGLMRQGKINANDLRTGLLGITNYSGATSDNLSFDSKGALSMPPSSFVIKTVRNGQFVILEQ